MGLSNDVDNEPLYVHNNDVDSDALQVSNEWCQHHVVDSESLHVVHSNGVGSDVLCGLAHLRA